MVQGKLVTLTPPTVLEPWATHTLTIPSGLIVDTYPDSPNSFAGLSGSEYTFTMAPSTDVRLSNLTAMVDWSQCATEGYECACVGTVIYGAVSGSASALMAQPYKERTVRGPTVPCTSAAMGSLASGGLALTRTITTTLALVAGAKECYCRGGVLAPSYTPTRKSYTTRVSSGIASITLTPSKGYKYSTIALGRNTGVVGTVGFGSAVQFTLKKAGSISTVSFLVTAQDPPNPHLYLHPSPSTNVDADADTTGWGHQRRAFSERDSIAGELRPRGNWGVGAVELMPRGLRAR